MNRFIKLAERIWIIGDEHVNFIDVIVDDILIFKSNLFWLKGVKDLSHDIVDRANLSSRFLASGMVKIRDEQYFEIGDFRVTKAFSKIKDNNYTIDLELQALNNDNWLEDGF